MKRLIAIVLCCFLCSGCGALLAKMLPVLTDIILATDDGEAKLNQVEQWAGMYFAGHDDEETERELASLISRARRAIAATRAAAHGAQELEREDYDAALAEFNQAFREIMELLNGLGVTREPGGHYGAPYGAPVLDLDVPISLQGKL